MKMNSLAPKIPQSEVSRRLQALMLLRVIVVSLLLGALIFIQAKETQTYFGRVQTYHYLLIATAYLVSFIYAILLKYLPHSIFQAYLQLFSDTFFITAVIYCTGGIDSIFSFLYILSIISGSIILYRKGGMIIASASSILYGLLLDLHYYGVISLVTTQTVYPEKHQSSYIFFVILANMVGFYVSAYLSSFLSEQARKSHVELRAKQLDFDKLEALNESIINSITSALVVLDGQNHIILFNPAAENIFGQKANHVYGRALTEALPILGIQLSPEKLKALSSDKDRLLFSDLAYHGSDDRTLHLRLSVSPLSLSLGSQEGKILVFQDITLIKEAEEEMKRVEGLAAIGELAAGIAHEIRNPMASISGSIEMLREGLDKDAVNGRLMDIISREVNRLNNLINDFLLFARPKKANLMKFDLAQLILECLDLFQKSRRWSAGLSAHTDFRHPIKMESDPEQIKQVLWNLFSNAVEAMGAQGCLYVSSEMEPGISKAGRNMVKIVVRDTGTGFDKTDLFRMFTPFFTTKERGSGLGMAIVKRIVEGLKGQVVGDNHPDGGARVTIYLPITT
jgi:two-component system sensor histidine kinase PilS (NtrC family)